MWKTVAINQKYEVNSNGDVRNIKTGRVLQGFIDKKGYKIYTLRKNGHNQIVKGHRIVALTFIENLENKEEVDHINGIKDDNRVENLRWSTHEENMENCRSKQSFYTKINLKINPKNFIQINGKFPVLQYDLNGNFLKQYESAGIAAKEIGVNQKNLEQVCLGNRHTCGNFIWRRLESSTTIP